MSSIKKNFVYNTIYHIFLILLPVITTPYISRILGAEAIGQFSYNYAIAVVFVMFAMLGLSNYGNRTIAERKDSQEKLSKSFWSIYSMQIVSGITVTIIYVLYTFFINNSSIAKIMLIHVASAIFDISWLFFGLEKFKLAALRSIIVKTIMTACVFIFVKNKNDLPLYSLIMCLSSLFSQLSLWPYVIRKIKFTKTSQKEMMKHVVPNLTLFIPVIAVGVYHYMDKVMLGLMSTDAEVGFYENSDKIVNVPMALVNSLGAVMLPRIANLISKDKASIANKYTQKSICFTMFLSTSMCFGIMAISRIFVPLYFGEGFEKCSSLFYVLLPSCIFLAFANVIRTQYLIPMKKDKIYVTSIVIGAIVNVTFNALLIPSLASVGAAIGTLLTQIFVCTYQAFMVRKDLPINQYIKQTIPFIISGTAMFLTLFLIINPLFLSIHPIAQLLIDIVVGAIIYISILCIISKLARINYIKILLPKRTNKS